MGIGQARNSRFALFLVPALGVAAIGAGALFESRAAAAPPPGPFKYNGAKSCGGSGCHDSKLTELPTWQKDPHSKGQQRLVILTAKRDKPKTWNNSQKLTAGMEKALKIKDASKAPACLTCHSVSVSTPTNITFGAIVAITPELKEQTFTIGDGVSCDACHGPSSAWLDPHDAAGWAVQEWLKLPESETASRSVALYDQTGLYYSKDLVLWARQCVRCHLAIDAELLEAKHPPLEPFELVSQSNDMRVPNPAVKPHWRDYAAEKPDAAGLPAPGPFHGVRAWQTGQVVALYAAALQLVERSAAKTPSAAKYLADGAARTVAHFEAVRPALEKADADAAKKIGAQVEALRKAVTVTRTAAAAGKAGQAIADLTDPGKPGSLARKLADRKADADYAKAVIAGVCAVSFDGRGADEAGRLAEQVGLGLRTLYASFADATKVDAGARKGVEDALQGMAKKIEKAEKGEFRLEFNAGSAEFKKGIEAVKGAVK